MDKDALALIAATIIARNPNHHSGKQYADAIDAALGANGYVVVSEPLLRELLAAASGAVRALNEDWYGGTRRRLSDAAAAVVEAVGPTT